MRLRKKKGTQEKLLQVESLMDVKESEELLAWLKEGRCFLEVGMGKGGFLTELALKNPENRYLGIDKSDAILLKANNRNEFPENLRIANSTFEAFAELIDDETFEGIYLNFSDPWPKARHAKRRLTYESFLKEYDRLLKPGGFIRFKTDSRDFFDFSVEEFRRTGRELSFVSYDLHHDDRIQDNIPTEYELRFAAEGKPIHALIYYKE
ncbi:tRNA (guanosine(46)-N7)-methyltransferase TrmB [Guggenheimella bovis]